MTASVSQTITLEEFLKLPNIEEPPAWEYANGGCNSKTDAKFRHPIIQKRLLRTVDDNSDEYTVLPELRCTFAGRSVPMLRLWLGVEFNSMKSVNQLIILNKHRIGQLKFFLPTKKQPE